MRLHHVGLEVRDLFALELFYRTAFGFTERYRHVSVRQPGLRTVLLERGGIALELLERPRDPANPARHPGLHGHLAIEVDDPDAEHARLAALRWPGVTLTPPRTTGDGLREVELRDPEGNVIELGKRVAPEPRPRVRAVIFDVDGTLVDSEENYFLADEALLGSRGIAFTREQKARYVGAGNRDMLADFKARFALPESVEQLVAAKNSLYLQLADRGTHVFPEMRRFLEGVRARDLPVAAASGSSPDVLRRILAATGLAGELPVVVSAEEVPRGKPAPDVFLEAARRLGVPPHECLVVEDARHGVEAAKRAFMACIAIPFLASPPLDPRFALADLLFAEGMSGFDAARALAWLDARRAP
jgi:HAD superfamily hydrolase (TIGR01509 family)